MSTFPPIGEYAFLSNCERIASSPPMIGQTEGARALCQKLLSFAGPLHLYAEQIDVTTGRQLGNFPRPLPTWP